MEEDGRNWLRRSKLCIKSCRAIIIIIIRIRITYVHIFRYSSHLPHNYNFLFQVTFPSENLGTAK
jgi:hypothetical protein